MIKRIEMACSGYILLTKHEGHTGRISARGLDKKDRRPIFSQYGPEQAWLIRDLLYDWRNLWRFSQIPCTTVGSFGTMPGPTLREYWTGNRAFWLVDFSYWPSDCLSHVTKEDIATTPWYYYITGLPSVLCFSEPIYIPRQREALTVKCLAQEHNKMTPAPGSSLDCVISSPAC